MIGLTSLAITTYSCCIVVPSFLSTALRPHHYYNRSRPCRMQILSLLAYFVACSAAAASLTATTAEVGNHFYESLPSAASSSFSGVYEVL